MRTKGSAVRMAGESPGARTTDDEAVAEISLGTHATSHKTYRADEERGAELTRVAHTQGAYPADPGHVHMGFHLCCDQGSSERRDTATVQCREDVASHALPVRDLPAGCCENQQANVHGRGVGCGVHVVGL